MFSSFILSLKHPSLLRTRLRTLLLVSFNDRCRPTQMPKMVVNCAVVHHGKRCFVFEEQQGDVKMKFRYAGFWWMGLYLSLRRSQETCWVFHREVWACRQVVQTFRSAHSVLGRGTWADCLLTDLPALFSFSRADLKHRFEMVVRSGAYEECCTAFLSPHLSSYPPKESHNFRLCRSVLKIILTKSCKW